MMRTFALLTSLGSLLLANTVFAQATPTTTLRPHIGRGERPLPHPETGTVRGTRTRPPMAATVGGGYVAADRGGNEHQFLIRAQLVGTTDMPDSDPDADCFLLIAQTQIDAVVGVNPTDLNALSVRFTPVSLGCAQENVDAVAASYTDLTVHALPSGFSRDTRIGRDYSLYTDIIGVEAEFAGYVTPQAGLFARIFASFLGVQGVSQGAVRDRPGFHGARLEAVLGATWILGRAFSVGIRAGAGFDIGVLGVNGGRNEDAFSNQDFFARVTANIAGYLALFGEASFMNRWDNATGNSSVAQVIGGLEVSIY